MRNRFAILAVATVAVIGGLSALSSNAQAFNAPSGATANQSPIVRVSDGGGDCGWFAITVCDTGWAAANQAANRYGGYAINTGDVDGFRAGYKCAVMGPMGKSAANRAKNQARSQGARTAYIKYGCM